MRFLSVSSSPASSSLDSMGSADDGITDVHLNVYDLTHMNNYFYWFGFGIFHSGIEVHGMEYGFGAHDYPTSGVFEVEPRKCPGFTYRCSIWLGATGISPLEFRLFLERLSTNYHGDMYHLIGKNCNHFTDDVCTFLTGKPIPSWVNRVARVGSFCNCLLPEDMQVRTVMHRPVHPASFEGSASGTSTSEESDDEDQEHQLLTTATSDMAVSRAKPVGII